MSNLKNTYHRDGTVTYWNVYTQTWQRIAAERISDRVLASMTQAERDRIALAIAQATFGRTIGSVIDEGTVIQESPAEALAALKSEGAK